MPTYPYSCETCNYYLEDIVSMDQFKRLNGTECPSCNEKTLQRRLSETAPGLVFKGWWPDKRRQKVKARQKRQAKRIDKKIQSGEMTQQDADHMARIRDKYAKTSPYLTDPNETKSGSKKKYPSTIKYNSSNPPPEPKIDGFDSKKLRSKKNKKE